MHVRVFRRAFVELLAQPQPVLAREQIHILALRGIKHAHALARIGVPVGIDHLLKPVIVLKLNAAALFGVELRFRLLDSQQPARAVVLRKLTALKRL